MYIHRSFLYVINRDVAENAGVFVVRSTNVTTMAAKSGRAQAAGPDLSKMNPTMINGANGAAMAPPRTLGRDKMIGKTVVIKKGPYKGLLGIVKDTVGDEARIELHTKNKIMSIKKELLLIAGKHKEEVVQLESSTKRLSDDLEKIAGEKDKLEKETISLNQQLLQLSQEGLSLKLALEAATAASDSLKTSKIELSALREVVETLLEENELLRSALLNLETAPSIASSLPRSLPASSFVVDDTHPNVVRCLRETIEYLLGQSELVKS